MHRAETKQNSGSSRQRGAESVNPVTSLKGAAANAIVGEIKEQHASTEDHGLESLTLPGREGRELAADGVFQDHLQRVLAQYDQPLEKIIAIQPLIWSRKVREDVDAIAKTIGSIIANCRDDDPMDIYEDKALAVRLRSAADAIALWAEHENGTTTLSIKAEHKSRLAIAATRSHVEEVFNDMLRNDDMSRIARITSTYKQMNRADS